MVKVRVQRAGAGGPICGFTVSGHAGFAKAGRDIVCAAVTALAETALIGLERVAGVHFASERRPGWLTCRLAGDEAVRNAATQVILETTVAGLRDIEKDYPRYLQVADEVEHSEEV